MGQNKDTYFSVDPNKSIDIDDPEETSISITISLKPLFLPLDVPW
jgi:hypothetical protein